QRACRAFGAQLRPGSNLHFYAPRDLAPRPARVAIQQPKNIAVATELAPREHERVRRALGAHGREVELSGAHQGRVAGVGALEVEDRKSVGEGKGAERGGGQARNDKESA